jgi:hypothetical protein
MLSGCVSVKHTAENTLSEKVVLLPECESDFHETNNHQFDVTRRIKKNAFKAATEWAIDNYYYPCDQIQMCGKIDSYDSNHISVYITYRKVKDEHGRIPVKIGPEAFVVFKLEDFKPTQEIKFHFGCRFNEIK